MQLQPPSRGIVSEETMKMYEKLMLEIYSHINEPDGIYGIMGSQQHSDLQSQIMTYEHEGNWSRIMGVYLFTFFCPLDLKI